jgi:LacI family transcriptional regulator
MSLQPTIQDVADAAGVSKATVSRYLNHHPHMSASTRQKVEDAIAKLDYHLNPLVAALMGEVRKNQVGGQGMVFGWINTMEQRDAWTTIPYMMGLFEGARQWALSSGCRLEVFWTRDKNMSPSRLQQILETRGIRGLLIPPASNIHAALPGFDWSRFAVVALSPSHRGGYPWHSVATHSVLNLELIMARLREKGYSRIGLAWADVQSASDFHSFSGRYLYDQFQKPKKDRLDPLVYADDFLSDSTQKDFTRWLERQRPDALICCDHRMKENLESRGLSVPDHIGLVHLNLASDVKDWTGMQVHSETKGHAAVDLLRAEVGHNHLGLPPEPRQILIPGEWVEGETTRKKL